ncbi:helix-turn-helix domain-containing protein [Streptomyces sp. NPDC091279]|uniref:helix-turn-helix domain-containing protein n=1 Tax=Streptomyces sp. NPDC091279 TaxID=3365983 RepID=UPI003830E935
MTVDDETGQVNDEADEPGWEVDPDDAWGLAVLEALGRQLRMQREQAGIKAATFGRAIGYGEAMVYKVEGGRRIPKQAYLLNSDKVLKANGVVAAMWEDFSKIRYPKTIRRLTELEARAVELQLYDPLTVHGLLQTPEYARALFQMRRPAYSAEQVEDAVAARMARRAAFERSPAPELSFVQDEWTLRRCLGGKLVLRRQLEHLLVVGQMSNVEIQIMPMDREEHAGVDGGIEVLKFSDGTATGRSPGIFNGRPVSEPKQLRILELRFGIVRAQALTPRESTGHIEQLLGET